MSAKIKKYNILMGIGIGVIVGLLFGLLIPIDLPYGNCNSSISFAIDDNFTINVFNGTDGTPIHEDSDQFECLFAMLSIIEFDPIIIDAYKNNATGTPLNETIEQNIGTYMSYKNVFIANAKFQLFLTMLFEGINGTLPAPTEDELNQLLTPLERDSFITTKTYKPALLAGISVILFNSTLLADIDTFDLNTLNDSYIINMAFLDTENYLNLAIPEAIESPFFIDGCSSLQFKLNSLEFNSTIDDGSPIFDLIEWKGNLNGDDISGINDEIPLNIPSLLQLLTLGEMFL